MLFCFRGRNPDLPFFFLFPCSLESVSVCLSKWELRGMKTPRADGEAEEEDAVVSERSEGNGKGER
jgi:hypothetical protein